MYLSNEVSPVMMETEVCVSGGCLARRLILHACMSHDTMLLPDYCEIVIKKWSSFPEAIDRGSLFVA